MFEILEREIAILKNKKFDILLAGDFNARTKDLTDFVEFDDSVLEYTGIEANDLPDNTRVSTRKLIESNIPLARASQDKMKNSHGDNLINLCRNCDLFIMNGRVGKDAGVGKTTCHDISVVDYAIGSAEVLCACREFKICDFNPLFSDVHNSLEIVFKNYCEQNPDTESELQNNTSTGNPGNSLKSKHIVKDWNEGVILKFNDDIDATKLDGIDKTIKEQDTSKIDDKDSKKLIDDAINCLNELLIGSAKNTFPVKQWGNFRPNDKPWFGKECRNKKNGFTRHRRSYLSKPNANNRKKMNNVKKEYKRTLNKFKKNFNVKFNDKLRKLSAKNPQDFWRIIKGKKESLTDKISLDSLYLHFKKLNEGLSDEHINDTELNQSTTTGEDEENTLNMAISEDEIRAVVKKLKNNKASGVDGVLNEFLKYGTDKIVTTLIIIFNLIFDVGIFPEAWLVGIIKPIYKNKDQRRIQETIEALLWEKPKSPAVDVKINNCPVRMILDTGASTNIVDQETYNKLAANGDIRLQKSNAQLFAYNRDTPLKTLGNLPRLSSPSTKLPSLIFMS
eukprot:gene4257-4822_t